MIKNSLQSCALNLPTDGSKDEEIHCFKENQPCKKGKEILASQLSILTEKDENPFTDSAEIDEDVNVRLRQTFYKLTLTMKKDDDIEHLTLSSVCSI